MEMKQNGDQTNHSDDSPKQQRNDCPTALKKLNGYFESGEKDIRRMDPWTQRHTEHCTPCADFFHKLVDPDYLERR